MCVPGDRFGVMTIPCANRFGPRGGGVEGKARDTRGLDGDDDDDGRAKGLVRCSSWV